MYVTRPNNWVANTFFDFVKDNLGIKMKTENLLRKSGLNYSILRPGKLDGEKNDKINDDIVINNK